MLAIDFDSHCMFFITKKVLCRDILIFPKNPINLIANCDLRYSNEDMTYFAEVFQFL